MTSRQQIESWLRRGVAQGHTHAVIVCDKFSYEDFPVYADSASEAHDQADKYDGLNMHSVREVYNLTQPLEPQLSQRRAYNF